MEKLSRNKLKYRIFPEWQVKIDNRDDLQIRSRSKHYCEWNTNETLNDAPRFASCSGVNQVDGLRPASKFRK